MFICGKKETITSEMINLQSKVEFPTKKKKMWLIIYIFFQKVTFFNKRKEDNFEKNMDAQIALVMV